MNINFIVNGELTSIEVNEAELLQKAVIDALIKAEYMDRPYKEWYAHQDGKRLQLDRPINDQREWDSGKIADKVVYIFDGATINISKYIGENA